MITLKLIPILISISLLFLAACKKDPPIDPEPTEPVMPPLTHQGLNTFGCYIDGELFVANDGFSYWSLPAVSGNYDETDKLLNIQASRDIEQVGDYVKSDDIRFRVNVLNGPAAYEMFFETDHYKGYMSYHLGRCRYYHDLNNRGTCEITFLDTDYNIISGRFQMTLINPDCEGDTLMKITDGRFDFKY